MNQEMSPQGQSSPAWATVQSEFPSRPGEDLMDADDDYLSKDSPNQLSPESQAPEAQSALVKRGRGRPRKHPLPAPGDDSKITKGRSKTGCVTCRRRKKKCDETKPECLNCQKNAVRCEGYPERVKWKSGREKAEEARQKLRNSAQNLPRMIDGIDGDIDVILFDHYSEFVHQNSHVNNDHATTFKTFLLPMAKRRRGLMHALLCLAAAHLSHSPEHLAHRSPYTPQRFAERQDYHLRRSIDHLKGDESYLSKQGDPSVEMVDDPVTASTIIMILRSIDGRESHMSYAPHMNAARSMMENRDASRSDYDFNKCVFEFFTFHQDICRVTKVDLEHIDVAENFTLPGFILQREAATLLGVLDPLFFIISRITNLRNRIRYLKTQGEAHLTEMDTMASSIRLECEIHNWRPIHPPGSEGYIAGMLYRQATWIYLYRTLYASVPSQKLCNAVDEGRDYLHQLNPDAPTQSILLLPLFILGCASFHHEQRRDVKRLFGVLKRYCQDPNVEPARHVVERIWRLMDERHVDAWDWELVVRSAGFDFYVS
ncbi:MAG: hypothetical protein M1814_006863 [Vezdaea aestivalis]|nr:MAG: hypothetical protein M1814_006863 [Vezdaea aestivalis]